MNEQQIKPTSELFRSQKNMFLSDRTKSREWRLEQLNRLEQMLTENSQAIHAALSEDFKTSWMERDFEFNSILATIAETREKLAQWMQPEELHCRAVLSAVDTAASSTASRMVSAWLSRPSTPRSP